MHTMIVLLIADIYIYIHIIILLLIDDILNSKRIKWHFECAL